MGGPEVSTNTTIEWADKTWSPIIGCARVSPGCDNCYAISTARIRSFNPNPKVSLPFAGTVDRGENGIDWTGKVNLLEERLTEPMRWKKPAKVFVNSMSDLFHKDVPDDFIARVFAIMALTSQHTYQILTKRHARMRSLVGGPCKCGHQPGEHLRSKMAWAVSQANPNRIPGVPDNAEQLVYGRGIWPLPNVHLGVSVEDQKWADIRIPALLETPAAIRFLSCEPLLGPVDLDDYLLVPCPCCKGEPHDDGCGPCDSAGCDTGFVRGIHWVIAGGESGPKARPAHTDWFRSLRDQCIEANVPFLFKQHGDWGPAPFIVRVCDPEVGWTGTEEELEAAKRDAEARGATHVHTGNWIEEDGERRYWIHEIGHKPWSLERVGLPDGTAAIRRWGKKRAGRELDGRTWDQFPEAVSRG